MVRTGPRRHWAQRSVVAVGIILGVLAGCASAWAFFSDPSTGQTNTFSAATLQAPTGLRAVMTSATTANLSWTGPVPATLTGYALTSEPSGATGGCSVGPQSGTGTSCTVSALTVGTAYNWTVSTAYDNWRSSLITTPSVSVSYPASGATYGGNWAGTLSGTASSNAGAGSSISGVSVAVENTTSGQWWNGSGFTSSSEQFQSASETSSWSLALAGSHLVSGDSYLVVAEAQDSMGNIGSSAAGFSYNTTGASVAFSFPSTGTVYTSGTWGSGAPIAGTVTDTNSIAGASAIALTVTQTSTGETWNGTAFANGTNTVTASTYNSTSGAFTYTFASTNFGTQYGSYTVSASVSDELGNSGSGSVGFTYDNSVPIASAPSVSATVTYGTNPVWVNHETVTLTNSPSDPGGSGAASVAYYYCPGTGSCTSANWASIGSSSAGGSWSVAVSDASLADGTYEIVAVATGDNGNTSAVSSSTPVGVDSMAPTVSAPTVSAATTYLSGGITYVKEEAVTLTDSSVTDSGSGVASVAYYYCAGSGTCNATTGTNINSSSTASNNYSVTWATPLPADGPYHIVAVATDNVGNASAASSSTAVTIDTTSPTVPTPGVNGYS